MAPTSLSAVIVNDENSALKDEIGELLHEIHNELHESDEGELWIWKEATDAKSAIKRKCYYWLSRHDGCVLISYLIYLAISAPLAIMSLDLGQKNTAPFALWACFTACNLGFWNVRRIQMVNERSGHSLFSLLFENALLFILLAALFYSEIWETGTKGQSFYHVSLIYLSGIFMWRVQSLGTHCSRAILKFAERNLRVYKLKLYQPFPVTVMFLAKKSAASKPKTLNLPWSLLKELTQY